MNRHFSNSITNLLIAAVAVIALGVSAETASANDYNRINRAAVKIRTKTKILLKETEHYVQTTNYRLLVSDTATLRQQAEHIREVARSGCDLDHLAADVAEMDRTFHHLEDLFDNTELLASQCQGSVRGHTAHVKRLLNSIEDCIHQMQEGLYRLRTAVIVAPPVVVRRPVVDPTCPYSRSRQAGPIVTNVETFRVPARDIYRQGSKYGGRSGYGGSRYGSRGYGGSGFSFSIGGGSSRMNFNF